MVMATSVGQIRNTRFSFLSNLSVRLPYNTRVSAGSEILERALDTPKARRADLLTSLLCWNSELADHHRPSTHHHEITVEPLGRRRGTDLSPQDSAMLSVRASWVRQVDLATSTNLQCSVI